MPQTLPGLHPTVVFGVATPLDVVTPCVPFNLENKIQFTSMFADPVRV